MLEDGVFIKEVKPVHYMRKYEGYGISTDVITQLSHERCQSILIVTADGAHYSSLLKSWVDYNKIANHGSGYQYFLPLCRMQRI